VRTHLVFLEHRRWKRKLQSTAREGTVTGLRCAYTLQLGPEIETEVFASLVARIMTVVKIVVDNIMFGN